MSLFPLFALYRRTVLFSYSDGDSEKFREKFFPEKKNVITIIDLYVLTISIKFYNFRPSSGQLKL